ncbi:MAG: hypothetical protein N3D79_01295 [Acidilobaceae archaeon]|nr:hypothetical protein [Acidilobaceae archaeon]
MDRDSISEACRALMRQKLSHYQSLFEGRLQDTLRGIARDSQASSLAEGLIGGLERVYAYSKLRLSEGLASGEGAEKLREFENSMLEASPPYIRDSIDKVLHGNTAMSSTFSEAINVLDALEAISFTGFMRTISLVEHMAYREFLEAFGQELERVANGMLDSLYARHRLDPGTPSLTAKAILQVVKPLAHDGYEKKLMSESYKVNREGAQVTVYPPLEGEGLLRLLSSTVDTALSINSNDLERMVLDSLVSVGYRREELDPDVIKILANIVRDLLIEVGQRREIIAKSLELAGSKLVPKLSHGLVQDHALYSLFASRILALAPRSPDDYMAVKRAVLRGLWGHEVHYSIEQLVDFTGQDMQSSIYLSTIKGKLFMEEERNRVKLKELFSDESIDLDTRRRLTLLYNEVFSPGSNGSLSQVIAICGFAAKLTRLESTRAWLTSTVSSIPVLLELATELSEALKRRGRGGSLIAKVSEDYVKETLLPGVVSMVPIAAYYFDVMEAPHLHREDKACAIRALTMQLVTDTSYREVVKITERINDIIISLARAESRASRRR